MRRTLLVIAHLVCSIVMVHAQRIGADKLTYWGGTGRDYVSAVTQAPNGDIVICGWTDAMDMATTENAYQREKGKGVDCFVARFTQSGELISSTYFGGSGNDYPLSIDVESDDNVLMAVSTSSRAMPMTSSLGYGRVDENRIIVVRLSPHLTTLKSSLHLLYTKSFYGVRVQSLSSGMIAINGSTNETRLPTTPDAYQAKHGGGQDGFLMLMNSDLDAVEYCTYDGGSKNDAISNCIDRGSNGLTLVGYTSTYDQFGDIRILILNDSLQPRLDTIYRTPDGEVANEAILRRTSDSTLFIAGYKGPLPLHGFVWSVQPNGVIRQSLEIDSTDLGVTMSYPFFVFARGLTIDANNRLVVSGSANNSARCIVFDKGLNAITERYELAGSGSDVAYKGWVTATETLLMVGSTSSPDLPTTKYAVRPHSSDTSSVSEAFMGTLRLLPSLYFSPSTIDLGNVPVGGMKTDSTLARPVNSRYPMWVDTVMMEPVVSDLTINPPRSFVIFLGGDQPISVTWRPTKPGPMSTTLRVRTRDASFFVNVLGNGSDTTTPPPRVTTSTLDFGVVRIGRNRERDLHITNESTETVTLTDIRASAAEPFILSLIPFPARILPGQSIAVPIRFTPADTGSFATVFDIIGERGVNVRTTVRGVCGKDTTYALSPSLGVEVGISVQRAQIGESFGYPVRITQGIDSLRRLAVEAVSFRYTYRRTILTVQNIVDSSNGTSTDRTIWLTTPWDASTDTMAKVQMTACIGDIDTSSVVVSDVIFTTGIGDVALDTTVRSVIKIGDPWQGSTPRTAEHDPSKPSLEAHPNPVTDRSQFNLHMVSPDATLQVFDVHGILLFSWTPTLTTVQTEVHLTIPDIFPPGAYVCVFRSNGGVVTYRFVAL